MRRIVIVCLLLLLPLQWSWAALGGVGPHECGCVTMHAGGDAGAHDLPDVPDDHCGGATAVVACGADCTDCHGQPHVGLLGVPHIPLGCALGVTSGDRAQHFRDHIPDHPLRPPLPDLA